MKSYITFLLRLLFSLLLTFALGRFLFMYYNAGEMAFSLKDVAQAWRHGFTMDLSSSSYVLILPWFCALVSMWWPGFPLRKVILPYLIIVGVLISVIICTDTLLYPFWKFKINASIFYYMTNPEGVTSSVSPGFILSRVLLILAFTAIVVVLLWKSMPRQVCLQCKRWCATVMWLLTGGFVFLFIRGGVQESVMNVGVAYYSPHLFLNHAAVNPAFSLLSSLNKQKAFSKQFNYLSEEECDSLFTPLYPADTSALSDTLLQCSRPNVLVVMMESFGGKFVKELGGLPHVATELSRLIPEGVFWDQFYANSFRTDRGTTSIFSGWVSYPSVSIMRLPEKLNHIPSLAHSLREEGYSNTFLYGGDIDFMNQKGYLITTGYDHLVSSSDFSLVQSNESKWGVNDSITTQRVFSLIKEMPSDRPWHLAFQTLSSHEPFEVPYHKLDDKVLNAFAFTDHCIGMLIDSLKTLPQWENTLVILLPDHGFLYELTYEDPDFFHCPMLWLGGALKAPRRISTLTNQSDVAATLLAQMGIRHDQFPWSRNVLSPGYTYPFVYSTFPGGILFADSTGVSVFDITSHQAITEKPSASPLRIQKAKAILQSSYSLLEKQ